jgi:hypothetical protein
VIPFTATTAVIPGTSEGAIQDDVHDPINDRVLREDRERAQADGRERDY